MIGAATDGDAAIAIFRNPVGTRSRLDHAGSMDVDGIVAVSGENGAVTVHRHVV